MKKSFFSIFICVAIFMGMWAPAEAALEPPEFYRFDDECVTTEGSWGASELKGYQNSPTIYCHSGAGSLTWAPEIPKTQFYVISLWNVVHDSNAEVLKIEVKDKRDSYQFDIPHAEGKSGFVELGVFEFEEGSNGYVKIISDGTNFIRANTIKYEAVTDDILATDYYYTDSKYAEMEGSWYESPGLTGHNGTKTIYADEGAGSFTWKPEIAIEGKYRVSVWNTPHSSNREKLEGEIKDVFGIHSFEFDHKNSEEGYVVIGEFEFNEGTDGYIKIFNKPGGFVRGNSVRYELLSEDYFAEKYYDVDAKCVEQEGSWSPSGTLFGYDDSRTLYCHSSTGNFAWAPEISGVGIYRVHFWNVVHETNCENLMVEVKDKKGVHSFSIPHKTGESGYFALGEFYFEEGTSGYVKVYKSSGMAGYSRVNSVKFEQITGKMVTSADVPAEGEEGEYGEYPTRNISQKQVSIPETRNDAVKVYVQRGSNGNGTMENPFGTIDEAKEYVRGLIASGYPANGIGVYLREGTYALESSLQFTLADSGSDEYPVIWQAYPGEEVTLSGSKIIPNALFKPIEDPDIIKRIPEKAQDKVYVADLTQVGIYNVEPMNYSTPYTLSIGGTMGTVARWPNEGYGKTGSLVDTSSRIDTGTRKKGFTYEISDPRSLKWVNSENVMLNGYWLTPYDLVATKVARFDEDAMTFSSKNYSVYGAYGNARYYAMNILDELDMAGEWYVDTTNNLLYIYPDDGWENKEIAFCHKSFDVVSFAGAKNVLLKGVKICDAGGSGVKISNPSQHCGVIGCEITNVSGNGAYIEGEYNFIRDCDISFVGQAGVNISGGNATKLIQCHNYIENNIIHDVGVSGSNRSGVSFSGCGLRMSNNHIYNTPHRGFSGSGLEHIIEYNVIERTNMDMNDTGAIYYGDLGMGYGTIIRYNLIRDSVGLRRSSEYNEGAMGIYIDQITGGVTVYGNLLYNMKEPALFNNCGRNNKWYNNILISCEEPRINAPWYNERTINMVRDNIRRFDITSDAFMSKYPELEGILEDENLQYSMYVQFYNNVNYACGADRLTGIEDKGGRLENNISFDHLPNCDFNTFLNFDYTEIKAQIPEFDELPVEEMGIYTGGARTTTSTVVCDNRADDFKLTYPADGEADVDPITTLKWTQGVGGILSYHVYIAEDPDFRRVISEKNIAEGSMDVELEYGKTYYWRVKEYPMLGYPERWNSNGVFEFTTMSADDKLNMVLHSAKALLEETQEGTMANQYPTGSKAELQAAIDYAETATNTQERTAIQKMEIAIQNYMESRIADKENLSTLIYDDFSMDTIGQMPLGLYLRSGNIQDGTAQADPLDASNIAIRFNDKEETYQHGQRYFARQGEYVEAGLSVLPSQTNATAAMSLMSKDTYIYLHGPISKSACKIVFEADGHLYAGKDKAADLGEYHKDTWYKIKIAANIRSKVYDVWINGVKKASNVPFDYDNIDEIGMLNFDTLGASVDNKSVMGQFYIDNMIVRAPVSEGKNPYLTALAIGGKDVVGFEPGNMLYHVNMSEEEFDSAEIRCKTGANAKVKMWKGDGYSAVTVISAEGLAINTYLIKRI